MIAASRFYQPSRRGDRVLAIALVALVHIALALALLGGFTVRIARPGQSALDLIEVRLPPPPLPRPAPRRTAAPRAIDAPTGGVTAPIKLKRFATVQPIPIVVLPVAALAAAGGAAGQGGPSAGTGVGGGQGGTGDGDGAGGGGSELVQTSGAIFPRDYPRMLRGRGIGGEVGVLFTVATDGRVSRCAVTRSSGEAELDALTCRLIEMRFVYRPATDRSGRPIAAEVEGEHVWTARVLRD